MSLNLSLKVEHLADVQAMIKALGPDARKASALWVNMLGEHMQGSMRKGIADRFNLRGTQAAFSRAVVFVSAKDTARGARQAVLQIGSENANTGTGKLGRMLARYEEAGQRSSAATFRTSSGIVQQGFFVPGDGMRTSRANPARNLYPKAIGIALRIGKQGKADSYATTSRKARKGKKPRQAESFFAMKDVGIFRRTAKGKEELLWRFVRQIRTPARTKLWETAQEVFNRFAAGYGYEAVQIVVDRGGGR